MPEEGAIQIQIGSTPVVTVENIEELRAEAELITLPRTKAEVLGNV